MTNLISQSTIDAVTKAGGAVLPVVGYFNSFGNALCRGVPCFSTDIPLTLHAPAQATIDELRAEVERLTRELHETTDDRDSWLQQADDRAADALRFANESEALKAKQIDVEAVMRLADEYAEARVRVSPASSVRFTEPVRAAREALRASLQR